MIANKLSTTRFTTVVLLSIAFNAILLYTCTLATRTMKFYFDFHTFKYSRIVSRCLLFIGAYFLKHHRFFKYYELLYCHYTGLVRSFNLSTLPFDHQFISVLSGLAGLAYVVFRVFPVF